MKKYFLGVDGGNTKTDYLLCAEDGGFVNVLRAGTCSHECFNDGYAGMKRVMRDQLSGLLRRNGIGVGDIAAAGFGLAGADLPSQIAELKKRVEELGFAVYGLSNDGILGIKGASDSGVGLCAVNGTGTVVVGIDETGEILQVGGVGQLSGDRAGGGHIRNQIMTCLYEYYYRCGDDSAMFQPIMKLLKANPDEMLTVVSDGDLLNRHTADIIQIGAKSACDGDPLAVGIFDAAGVSIGRSAAGCIRRLSFNGLSGVDAPIDIVLVGSIWYKIPYDGLNAAFIRTVEELGGRRCRPVRLEAPAAVGGVLWAKEIADGKPASAAYRKKLLEDITMEKYESLIKITP
jgi:N-acetylglucosamine kinase-like BadF-type ATPase